MRARDSVHRGAVLSCIIGLVISFAMISQVGAQVRVPDYLRVIDRDYGRRLWHAPAYRGTLDVRSSFRVDPIAPRYDYRFFDHPIPSFQFFQKPQAFKFTSYFLLGPEPQYYGYGPWGYWGPSYSYWEPSPPSRYRARCDCLR